MEDHNKTTIEYGVSKAAQGDLDAVNAWLKAGNDPNNHDPSGWTPLLKASARGHHEIVGLLLNNPYREADLGVAHNVSKALPIHMAGHSGSVLTAKAILEKRPDHLDAVWDLNGHTILLQAAFYGHLDLADYLVKRGADTSLTTARGLGAMELAKQFQNDAMIAILAPYDTPAEKKAENYKRYLHRIAPIIPDGEKELHALTEELIQTITNGIGSAFTDEGAPKRTLDRVRVLVEERNADVNRLGGPLQQPPLVVVVTGNNGFPANRNVEQLRNTLAEYLLKHGADPTLHEIHPMSANAIIRACVFSHLAILKMCSKHISKQQLADALNEIPVVNGLTALHDTVLRATTADPEFFEKYLEQARWCMESGARSDTEDFAGRTQKDIARNARNETYRNRLLEIL